MSPSDLVLKVSLNLHEQSSADEERFDRMAIRTFDIDLFVPSALHDARNAEGVLAVALDDLHPKRGFRVSGIDTDDRQPHLIQFGP